MSTPSNGHFLPIPEALRNLSTRILSLYTRPSDSTPPLSPLESPPTPSSSKSALSLINPSGLAYAWRIADAALSPTEKSKTIKKGMMGEPTGSGVNFHLYL
jgi:hypothetical protein